MARAVLRHIVFGLAATGLLMGCVESGGKAGSGNTASVVPPPAKKGKGGDVEAPDVFQTTDTALWDGRPSLGGIWIASPEATDPERVMMVNTANGKTITGALFRRERDNPGPTLQLSSDAAEALGILAGQPTELKVTALRKEEVEEPEPAAAVAPTEGEVADAEAKPKDGEAAAIASAALDAVDAGQTDPATKTDGKTAEGGDAAAVAAATAAGAAAVVVDDKPKRKTWKERRAEAKAAREAKKKAAAEAKAAAAAAAAGTAPEGETAATGEAPTADTVAVAPIESAPLDARKPEVVKKADKASDKVSDKATAKKTPKAEAAPAPEPAPEAASTGPSRPIQVASFSKEDNAKRAAEALAKIGVTATPQKSDKNGKAVWGVIVMGDDAMLKKIKDAGFADAYFLK